MAAWITFGTAVLAPNSWSWRLPSLLQAAPSVFQLIMAFLMPESPRWLIATGRQDKARQILTKYHAEGDEHAEIVRFEMAEIQHTLEVERINNASSWSAWFRTRANRHRFLIVLTLGFILQWSGNAVVSYFLSLMLDAIGITNSTTQLIINGGIAINGKQATQLDTFTMPITDHTSPSGLVWSLLWYAY